MQLLFSIRFGRGQGSAAGAAEDHMTCIIDAWKCMGLFPVLCDMWYFVDVHVGCLEVQGTLHMMAAKLSTLSYLKRGWDNDLTFERASRSLAKTGSFLALFGCLFLRCFLGSLWGCPKGPKRVPKRVQNRSKGGSETVSQK